MDFREPPKGKDFQGAFYSKRRSVNEKQDDSKVLTDTKENLEESIDILPRSSTLNQNENVSQPSLLSKDEKLPIECNVNMLEISNSKISDETGFEHKLDSKRIISTVSDETASETKGNPSGISATVIPDKNCPEGDTSLTRLSSRVASGETDLENKIDSLHITSPEENASERNVALPSSSNVTIPCESSPLSPTGVLSHENVSSNEKTEFFFKLPDKILIRIFEEEKDRARKQVNRLPSEDSPNKVYDFQADSTSHIETVAFGGKIGCSRISDSTVPKESFSSDIKDSLIGMSASTVPETRNFFEARIASMRQETFARKSNSVAAGDTSMEKDRNSLRLSSSMSAVEAVPEIASLPQISIPNISHEASLTSAFSFKTDLAKYTSKKSSVPKTGSLKPTKGCILKCSLEFDLILRRRRPSRSKVSGNEENDGPNSVSSTPNRSPIAGEESSENTASTSETNMLTLDEDSLRALNILVSESLSSLPELSEKFVRKVKERKKKKAARKKNSSRPPVEVRRRNLSYDSSKPSTSKMSPDSKSRNHCSHSVTKPSSSAINTKFPIFLPGKIANSQQEEPDTENANSSRKKITFPCIFHSSVPPVSFNRILDETKTCTSIKSRIRLFSVGAVNQPTTSRTFQPTNSERRQLRHLNFLTNPLAARSSVVEPSMGDNISEVNRNLPPSDSSNTENDTNENRSRANSN